MTSNDLYDSAAHRLQYSSVACKIKLPLATILCLIDALQTAKIRSNCLRKKCKVALNKLVVKNLHSY